MCTITMRAALDLIVDPENWVIFSTMPPLGSLEATFLRLLQDRLKFVPVPSASNPEGFRLPVLDKDAINPFQLPYENITAKNSQTYPKLSDFSADLSRLAAILTEEDPQGNVRSKLSAPFVFKFFTDLNLENNPSISDIASLGPLSIPAKFANLKTLNLSHCKLLFLEPALFDAPNLQQLNVYSNLLAGSGVNQRFDAKIHTQRTSLKFLGAGFNALTDLEDILDWFPHLMVLDASYNHIQTMDVFNENVVKIDLRGNPISLCSNFQMLMADMLPKSVPNDAVKRLKETATAPIEGPMDVLEKTIS